MTEFCMQAFPMSKADQKILTCPEHRFVSILSAKTCSIFLECVYCGKKESESELMPDQFARELKRITSKIPEARYRELQVSIGTT